jgi:hypothetical protein
MGPKKKKKAAGGGGDEKVPLDEFWKEYKKTCIANVVP